MRNHKDLFIVCSENDKFILPVVKLKLKNERAIIKRIRTFKLFFSNLTMYYHWDMARDIILPHFKGLVPIIS